MNELKVKDFLLAKDPVGELFQLDAANEVAVLDENIAALRMPIPAGHHHKDNLTHSIKVLENAINREENGPDLILRTAALYHDVGKPATRSFKGGKVSFHSHEMVGARMVKRILPAHGYTHAEVAEVKHLVALHMRGYSFSDVQWSDAAVRRLINDAGSELALQRLIKLFYSDLTSKQDKVRRRVEAGIARLEDAFAEVMAKDARASLRPAFSGHEIMELTGLSQGPELGRIMKFLNRDEQIVLAPPAALEALREQFPEHFGGNVTPTA